MKLVLLLVLSLVAVSCGKGASKKTRKSVNQIFVQGNPLVMISGTQKDTTPIITASNSSSFKNYRLSGLQIFTQRSLITESEADSIESGNEAEMNDRTTSPGLMFSFNRFENAFSEANGKIKLRFTQRPDGYALDGFAISGSEFDVVPRHYSISSDKSKMSFLFSFTDVDAGEVLIAATFYLPASPKVIPQVSKKLYYIFGPGVVVPWKLDKTQRVSINVCPEVINHVDFETVKRAVKAWEAPFAVRGSKFEINPVLATSCKPFSDVNEHGLYYVAKYLTMPDADVQNPAFTTVDADFADGHIFDADILLLGAEINKNPRFGVASYAQTLTHEFGHYLGLSHQFDGPTSIMSYKEESSLGSYDYEAISTLYQRELLAPTTRIVAE